MGEPVSTTTGYQEIEGVKMGSSVFPFKVETERGGNLIQTLSGVFDVVRKGNSIGFFEDEKGVPYKINPKGQIDYARQEDRSKDSGRALQSVQNTFAEYLVMLIDGREQQNS